MSFEKLISDYTEAHVKLVNAAKDEFQNEVKVIFEQHPELTYITWTQYTPYFNDGEECIFSVGEVCVSNTKEIDNISPWGEYEGDDESEFVLTDWMDKKNTYKDVWELAKFLNSDLGEEMAKNLFGDHARVIVSPSGVEVEEYSHD